ncbi:MAG: 2TM domain-containing protein [Bacteroidota bacterium]
METKIYQKYERAKKRVEAIKGFYKHIKVFVLINIFILVGRFYLLPQAGMVSDDEGFNNWLNWNTFIFPGIWAVVMTFHGLSVFGYKIGFFKKWEQQKIKEFMEEDLNEEKRYQ